MPEVVFEPRYELPDLRNPALECLREIILDPFRPGRAFGEAGITFRDGERVVSLLFITDPQWGYYLKYNAGVDEWLSLGDSTLLEKVICPDDCQASAGLFISAEKAWLAIREFCVAGTRCSQIDWIRPRDVPPDGNY